MGGNQHPSPPAISSFFSRVVFGVLGAGLKWSVGGRWLGCITGSEGGRMEINCCESLGKGGEGDKGMLIDSLDLFQQFQV